MTMKSPLIAGKYVISLYFFKPFIDYKTKCIILLFQNMCLWIRFCPGYTVISYLLETLAKMGKSSKTNETFSH